MGTAEDMLALALEVGGQAELLVARETAVGGWGGNRHGGHLLESNKLHGDWGGENLLREGLNLNLLRDQEEGGGVVLLLLLAHLLEEERDFHLEDLVPLPLLALGLLSPLVLLQLLRG